MKTYLFTFHTNFDALQFYRFAKQNGEAKQKPVPRSLSSSCGTCVIFRPKVEIEFGDLEKKPFECAYEANGDEYIIISEKE
ncbi:hypothetical protein M2140_001149 [Clostridiales Family XIII bacterium PM5-7]